MIDPDHLLQLADELSLPPRRGRPEQVRLRRAVSSAYYAAFHDICTQATDLFVGATERQHARYLLVYRSFDHREIKAVCLQSAQSRDSSPILKTCAGLFVDLQAARHEADYNPSRTFTVLDVQSAVQKSRQMIFGLELVDDEERKLFLTSLKFKNRT